MTFFDIITFVACKTATSAMDQGKLSLMIESALPSGGACGVGKTSHFVGAVALLSPPSWAVMHSDHQAHGKEAILDEVHTHTHRTHMYNTMFVGHVGDAHYARCAQGSIERIVTVCAQPLQQRTTRVQSRHRVVEV